MANGTKSLIPKDKIRTMRGDIKSLRFKKPSAPKIVIEDKASESADEMIIDTVIALPENRPSNNIPKKIPIQSVMPDIPTPKSTPPPIPTQTQQPTVPSSPKPMPNINNIKSTDTYREPIQ